MTQRRFFLLCFFGFGLALCVDGQARRPSAARTDATRGFAPPVHLTAEQDRERMLELLHIRSLRPGPSGNPTAPNAANYDEAKAGPFGRVPDPLVLNDGERVTSARMWWRRGRPQVVEEFNREIYGFAPKRTPAVRWQVIGAKREMNGDVPVITKTLAGRVDNSSYPALEVNIQLTLTTPASTRRRVPVIMELDFSPEFMAELAKRFPQFRAPTAARPSWQQQVLAKGWGYASYIPTSVQADNGAGLTGGIIGLMNKGRPRKLDDWGALRAWAWGASRALDYFQSDRGVDAKQVGIAGHSRYGKAALVAMAYDPRFAIGYISSSGESGAKLYRHIFGEPVENVAGANEYHWMAGNFLKYAGPLTTNDLPVDANELIALCAPRPVFISGGATQGDGWVDAKGMFLAAVGGGPVYRLLGAKDLGTTEFPPIGTALMDSDIAFRQHHDGHSPAPNWPYFLKFASRYFR